MIKTDINPEILEWARKEAGYTPEEIAIDLEIPLEVYQLWEREGKEISFSKLKEISKKYKRQIACFFLSEIPKKKNKPKDYRNLTNSRQRLSPKTLHAMHVVSKCQDLSTEILGANYWVRRYEWLEEIKQLNSTDSITDWLRTNLGIGIEDQYKYKTSEQALKQWRNALENKLGILTFQFPMPENEIQGFCYTDDYPLCIAINSKYAATSRIFTLFHEVSHILKKQSGLCLSDFDNSQQIEITCNEFAGEFLIPKNSIIPAYTAEEIYKYSKKFKISSEVYLRRLRTLGYMNDKEEFDTLLKEIRANAQKTGAFGKSTPIGKSKASRGEFFFNTIVEALHKNQLSFVRASDSLGIHVKHLLK